MKKSRLLSPLFFSNTMTLCTLVFTAAIFTNTANAKHLIEYSIRIDGITCPFCVASSENALKKIDGIQTISTNIETGTMTVCAEPTVVLEDAELEKLFLKKGFTYRSISQSDSCSIDDDDNGEQAISHAHKHTSN